MAGAIIENMSTKKLVIVGITLLLFQALAFMVGGLIGKFSCFIPYFICSLANARLHVRPPVETRREKKKRSLKWSCWFNT